jgi:fructosamine-3-kinase
MADHDQPHDKTNMLTESTRHAIAQTLNFYTPCDTKSLNIQPIGGGSINDTYSISLPGNQRFFCKVNSASNFPHLFQKENKGLALISEQKIIGTPKVIDQFETNDIQFLLLEWINPGERTSGFWKKFGERLAQLHQKTQDHFGLNEDNYMGNVPQSNKPEAKWVDFFRDQRLKPLVDHCIHAHLLPTKYHKQFNDLYQHLPSIFNTDHIPSLVHGDLWSGNFMCNENSDPILIDPAVYFGHPSIDLGMTTLFGGFDPAFYEAYRYHSPFPYNYKEQWLVCNLYPLLIHLKLFGTSYLSSITRSLNAFS